MNRKAVVIGASSGGLNAMKVLLPALPAGFSLPVILVQHVGVHSEAYWINLLNTMSKLDIKEAEEKDMIEKGNVYIAPPNYHLLVERDHTLSFSTEKKINFSRPSIDVLFESAAEAYKDELVGIILTGSNNDGAWGLKKIKDYGGLTVAQDPQTAEFSYMPAAAISLTSPDHVLTLDEIVQLLLKLDKPFNPL